MKEALIRLDLRQRVINAAGKLIHVSQVTGAPPSTVDTTPVSRLEKTNRETHVNQINDFAVFRSPWRPFVSEIRKTALQSHEKISWRKKGGCGVGCLSTQKTTATTEERIYLPEGWCCLPLKHAGSSTVQCCL
jgi:hypothetical protein